MDISININDRNNNDYIVIVIIFIIFSFKIVVVLPLLLNAQNYKMKYFFNLDNRPRSPSSRSSHSFHSSETQQTTSMTLRAEKYQALRARVPRGPHPWVSDPPPTWTSRASDEDLILDGNVREKRRCSCVGYCSIDDSGYDKSKERWAWKKYYPRKGWCRF